MSFTVRKIRTTAGIRYITGRYDGKSFHPFHSGKEYKTKAGALRSLKRRDKK